MARIGEILVKVQVEHKLSSFIPVYYEQALLRRALEQMKREGYVVINEQGDAVSFEQFARIVNEAAQYEVSEEEWQQQYEESARKIARVMGVSYQELGLPWQQEYLKPHDYLGDRINMSVQRIDSVTASTSHLGYPAYQPNLPAMPASSLPVIPAKAPEPEFGVVVIGGTEVPLSTVNALLSGKFIHEGENIDTSFRQYIVLFRDDDWHRNEAINLRQQLRDLIRGVEVVLVPVNGG